MTSFPKPKRWHSDKYERWISSQPCAECGTTVDVCCHHLKGVGSASGVGIKASSAMAMPLCVACHAKMHSFPVMWPDQWRMIALTLGRAIEDGVLKI